MKLNIFYEDYPEYREMDILTLQSDGLSEVKQFLKSAGIDWYAIIYGPNTWGWSREFDFHVFQKEPDDKAKSIIMNLFPSKENGGKTNIITK
jgi:hypothetical protein